MVLSQCGLNIVSMSMVVSSAAHHSLKIQPRVSLRLSSPWPGGLLLHVFAIPHKTCSLACSVSRTSSKTVILQSEKTPLEGVQECSREHSNDAVGPVVKRALTLSSLKEGEEWQACDADISIQTKSKEQILPSSETAHKQSMPIGCPSEVVEGMWFTRATTYTQECMNTHSAVDDKCIHHVQKIPPGKMMEPVNLWHSMNVIREIEEVSIDSCSPDAWANRTLLKVGSPQSSNLQIHNCKKTPSMVTNSLPVMSAQQVALVPHCSNESALFLQVLPSPSQLSSGLSRLFPKFCNNEDYKLQPCKVVSSTNGSSVEWCSSKAEHSTPYPVSIPDATQAFLSHLLSLEGQWQVHCKPPNCTDKLEQCNSSVINRIISSSTMEHLPPAKVTLTPPVALLYQPLSVSVMFRQAIPPNLPSPEPNGLVIKSSHNEDYGQQLNKVINSLDNLNARLHSPKLETEVLPSILKLTSIWAALLFFLSIGLWWWARHKPPYKVTQISQWLLNVISTTITGNTSGCSHEFQRGSLPVSEPSHSLAVPAAHHHPSLGFIWQIIKLLNGAASQWSVNKFIAKIRWLHLTPGLWPSSSCPVFSCLHTAPEISSYLLQLVRTSALCTPDMSDRHIYFSLTVI